MRGSLWLATLLAARAARAEEGLPRNAFVGQLQLGIAAPIYNASEVQTPPIVGMPGLELGARLRGRFQVGLVFSVLVPAGSLSTGGFTDYNFIPNVEYDLAKLAQDKAAVYVRAGAVLGVATTKTRSFIGGLQSGLGFRYATSRILAIGFEGGLFATFRNPPEGRIDFVSFYLTGFSTFYSPR